MTYLFSIVTRFYRSIVLISILILFNLSVCIVETKTCNDAKKSREIVQIYIYIYICETTSVVQCEII